MKSSLSLLPFLVLSGCIGLYDDVSGLVDKARCNLRVGVLSDTHLTPPHSDRAFLKALTYFAQREVDAVVLAGDVTQDGNLAQRRRVRELWQKAFPDGRRSDGAPVELILVTGENDGEKVYEELTGQPFAPAFARDVKGYTFIGANWRDATGVDAWALKAFLAARDKSRPFFYLQNLIPYGTCCPGETRTGLKDGGKVSYMLSKFPNAVAICGRSHTPLTDESAFWHGEFTCVNAGSFVYSLRRDADDARRATANHGLVMSVYDSEIVFERLDFTHEPKQRLDSGVYAEALGPAWRVKLPAKPAAPPERAAPRFWDDTRLMIFPTEKSVSVRFPPVLAKHTGVRAHDYEVAAIGPDGEVAAVRTVVSPAFASAEDRETQPVSCEFMRTELPVGRVRFAVTPLDAFGTRGNTVTGETSL